MDAETANFCRHHDELYIYGAGERQKTIKSYLDRHGIPVKGFVVSKDRYEAGQAAQTVIDVRRNCENIKEIGFLIAISDAHYNVVLKEIILSGFGLDNIFIMSGSCKQLILREMRSQFGESKGNGNPSIDQYISYYEYIERKCKKGEYNLFLHRHLGDSIALLGLRKAFETKYKKRVHYIIQSHQEALVQMYGIKNYTVADLTKLMAKEMIQGYKPFEIDRFQENLCERIFPAIPQVDHPFIAAPAFWIQECLGWSNFVDGWAKMLGLNVERIEPPKKFPEMSHELEEKIRSIAELKQIILLAPEAQTFEGASKSFWSKLAKEMKAKGFSVVTNAMFDDNQIEGTHNIKMSVSDLLSLGMKCHSVHSLRSGLCDSLAYKGRNLYVYYKPEMNMEYFSINKCFILREPVNEIVITDQECQEKIS